MVRSVERQFDDTDIIFSQWLTLKLVAAGTIHCIGDVVRELAIESGAATRLVDQLEMRGLLRRIRSQQDRRVVRLSITSEGRRLIDVMLPKLQHFWDEQLAIFEPAELRQLFVLLGRLRDGLQDGTSRELAVG